MAEVDSLIHELERLRGRISQLEDDHENLLKEVKDIMTVYEQRVLREIENLSAAKIEPMDKIVSALMITISDMFIKFSAFVEAYEGEATPEFREKVQERTKYWKQETLMAMRQADEAVSIKDATENAIRADDRKSSNTQD